MELKVGQKVTLFAISDAWAVTCVDRRLIRELRPDGGMVITMNKKPRTKLLWNYKPERETEMLLFDGWELPFKADSETNKFHGNACLNFVGDPDVIRDYIENKNLNEAFDAYGKVIHIEHVGDLVDSIERPLFPMHAIALINTSGHAVVEKILQKLEKQQNKGVTT